MASGIIVFAEIQDQKVKRTTYELLSKAKELIENVGGEVNVALLGHHAEKLAPECSNYGAENIYIVDHEKLATYSSSAFSKALFEIIKQKEPAVVLGSASALGKDLFPKVAAKLGVPLVQDCTYLEAVSGGEIKAKRPMYAGKVISQVSIPKATPKLFTCRPNSFPIQENKAAGKVEKIDVQFNPEDLLTLVKEVVKGTSDKVDLTEADIIVSGGRSLGSGENFKILQDLADVLGAAVGASRAAVDAGYVPHSMQVGQTGKTVNPKLYIACGISGAIQHLAGMQTSKVIVAINKDPEAPIFKVADYGIVDDLFTVVPLLTKGFKDLLSH